MPVVLFNLAMLAVDWGVLRLVWARRSVGALLTGGAAASAAVLVLAGLGEWFARSFTLFGPLFTFLGLVAWGVFLHGPLLLLGGAASLWRRARSVARGLTAAALASIVFAVYAFGIEPTWLEVTHYEITSPKLDRRVRIVVLADLQTDRIGAYEERVIRAAVAQRPDLLLLPGDYLHVGTERCFQELRVELNRLLRREHFGAPLGVYAVRGNVDHNEWQRLFEGLDVTTFPETASVALDGLHLTALDLEDSFRTDLHVPARDGFHVVFGHGPDFALGDVPADLLVAGHTHGGQVRIPGFGPPLTLSKVPRAWAAGRTPLPGGRTLIVSRGTGLERGYAPRIRFLCRPELVVIDLVPEAGS